MKRKNTWCGQRESGESPVNYDSGIDPTWQSVLETFDPSLKTKEPTKENAMLSLNEAREKLIQAYPKQTDIKVGASCWRFAGGRKETTFSLVIMGHHICQDEREEGPTLEPLLELLLNRTPDQAQTDAPAMAVSEP